MYLGGNGGDDINKYTLTTAWDVSSLAHVKSYSVSSQTGNMMGFVAPYIVGLLLSAGVSYAYL